MAVWRPCFNLEKPNFNLQPVAALLPPSGKPCPFFNAGLAGHYGEIAPQDSQNVGRKPGCKLSPACPDSLTTRGRMSVSPLVVSESVANFVRRSTDSLTTRGKLTYGLADGRKNGCPLSMPDSLATRGKLTSGLADGRKKAPF